MIIVLRLLLGAIGGVILTAGLRWGLWCFDVPLNWPNGQPVSWVIIIAAGAVIGMVDAAIKTFQDHRRLLANQTLAERQEWTFSEWVDPLLPDFRRTLSLFRRDSLQTSHRMTGSFAGRAIDLLDVSYSETTGSGKSRSTQTYNQTVYRFPGYGQSLCPFRVVPRSRMFRWLEGLLTSTETELHPPDGLDEDQAAAFETFRKQYQLSIDSIGIDTNVIPRVFHPFVVAWFSLHPGWVVETDQVDLLIWTTGRRDCGEQRLARLEEVSELIQLFEAGERATETLGAVEVERKPHAPKSILNKPFIVFFGTAMGMMAGFFCSVVLMLTVHPLVPKGPWNTPAFIAMFLVPMVLGMISGIRFGYLHATGVELAKPWERK